MLKEKLRVELQKLVDLYPEDNRNDIEKRYGDPLWKNDSQGDKCLDIINQIPEYKTLIGSRQWFNNMGLQIETKHILSWLLNRSRKIDSKNSILELDLYILNPKAKVELVELLKGSMSKNPYQFSNGVFYIDINTIYQNPNFLNNDSLTKKLSNNILEVPSKNTVTGIFTVKFEYIILYNKKTDDYPTQKIEKLKNIPLQKLKDTRLCLSLVLSVKGSIYGLGTSIYIPENIPHSYQLGQAWRNSTYKESGFSSDITNSEFEKADKLLIELEKLDQSSKDKLHISLERLNNFGSAEPLVDRAIELRICLESIFLNDGNKEQLRFRLALRAALFLGKNLEERKEIFKTIKSAYDITSTAVHSGKLSSKAKTNILFKAAELAKLAIIKLINHGIVNWEDLELKKPHT